MWNTFIHEIKSPCYPKKVCLLESLCPRILRAYKISNSHSIEEKKIIRANPERLFVFKYHKIWDFYNIYEEHKKKVTNFKIPRSLVKTATGLEIGYY